MKYFRLDVLLLCACLAILSGCVTTSGKDFPSDLIRQFTLGKTDRSQVLAQFGQPQREETITARKDVVGHPLKDGAIVQVAEYMYAERLDANAALPGIVPRRRLILYFVNDVMIGYRKASSFRPDSTNFDIEKTSAIEKNKTTEQQVLALLGPASGRGIYPLSGSPKGTSLYYDIDLFGSPPGSKTVKALSVHFSPAGVVEDFSASSKSEVIPRAPAPTTVPIYIYTPVKAR